MPRKLTLLLTALGVLAVLLVVAQLALPAVAERRAEDRLTRDGGTADVSVGAFPAVRLLFGDGDSLEATGRGLRLEPGTTRDVLGRLDGFGEVDVRLEDVRAGPLDARSFVLTRRKGQRDYDSDITGTASPREVARLLGTQTGGALGGLLGDLAGGALGGDAPLPVQVRCRVQSRNGEPNVYDVQGTVAGVPAGPLAEVVVRAVVRSL